MLLPIKNILFRFRIENIFRNQIHFHDYKFENVSVGNLKERRFGEGSRELKGCSGDEEQGTTHT